jgi:hypothetical protein
MTIREIRVRLAAIETAIDDCIATSAEYSVPGGGTVKNHSLTELTRQRDQLRRQLRRLQGYSARRTLPDFSC